MLKTRCICSSVMSQFNYSRNITFDIIVKTQFIKVDGKSQFNYSRNITFDGFLALSYFSRPLNVAIQLFAEYNFWYAFDYEKLKINLSQFNYSRNITFDIVRNYQYSRRKKSQFNYSRNITFDYIFLLITIVTT